MGFCHVIAQLVGDPERWSHRITLNSLLDQPSACAMSGKARISEIKTVYDPNNKGLLSSWPIGLQLLLSSQCASSRD